MTTIKQGDIVHINSVANTSATIGLIGTNRDIMVDRLPGRTATVTEVISGDLFDEIVVALDDWFYCLDANDVTVVQSSIENDSDGDEKPSHGEAMTESSTGGKKGSKLARFDLIPAEAMWKLAEHYGIGESKYPTGPEGIPNFRKGYEISKSVSALERHLNLFKQGIDVDEDTGSDHIIAVAWHALFIWQTLYEFEDLFDDRISKCRERKELSQ